MSESQAHSLDHLHPTFQVEVPPYTDFHIAFPAEGGEEYSDQEGYPEQPRIVGEQLTNEQFDTLYNAIASIDKDGAIIALDPTSGTAKVPEELLLAIDSIMPVIALELAYGNAGIRIKNLAQSRGEPQPWHIDFGTHDKRIYLMSDKPGQTTEIANSSSFYRDEAGYKIDNSQYSGWAAADAPEPLLSSEQRWQPPEKVFTGIFGDTLHHRPTVDLDRRGVEILGFTS